MSYANDTGVRTLHGLETRGSEPLKAPGRLSILLLLALCAAHAAAASDQGALAGHRPRVIVSTDIGGTDPDDFQSMVHLLLYADVLDIEGLISSPWGPGRREHILEVVDRYAVDYPKLKTDSQRYPTPDSLRAVTRQGAIESALGEGTGSSTDGSKWIVRTAHKDDPRPLWVLVWGAIDDLAQALHDDPTIAPKLRVYYIAGPNKKWGVAAYEYIVRHHPDLWMIESNSTYRGWFAGGDQGGEWGNDSFIARRATDAGAMGGFLAGLLKGSMKMGDTPSVAYLLRGVPADPSQPGWGGRYVRAWARSRLVVEGRPANAADQVEQFGVIELIPRPAHRTRGGSASLLIDGQEFPASIDRVSGQASFRFMPKDAKTWTYRIKSSDPELDGKAGAFASRAPEAGRAVTPDPRLKNWWTDDPAPALSEGPHQGARTVSQFRREFLQDFAERLARCRRPSQAKKHSQELP